MKKFYSILMAQAVLVSSLSAVSCTEDIEIDMVDENAYANVTSLIGTLRDANSGKVSTIVDMYHDTYNTNVAFTLSRAPKAGVDVKVEYDAEYVDQYNKPEFNHQCTVTRGILEGNCSNLLTTFFTELRKRNKEEKEAKKRMEQAQNCP